MSFNTNTGRAEYIASTGQTLFPFVFKIFNNIDIKVYKTLANIVPNETNDLLILDTDYTVSIDGDAGGSITLLSAASIDDAITLLRDLSTTREIEYQTSGDLLAETLNDDQEYQTYLLADNKQISERTLIFEKNLQGMDNILPTPQALKILRWRADEKALENASIVDDGVFVNVFNVSTMEDILTTSYTAYSTVNVRGYYSENDDGGGLFNWNSSMNKANANGGIIIDPSVSLPNQGTGIGAGCWIRQYSGAVNVSWFGAVNSQNSTEAIKKAFASLSSNSSLIIEGEYIVEPTDENITDILEQDRDYALFYLKSKQRIKIHGNGKLIYNKGTTTKRVVCIILDDCYGCSIDGIEIAGGFIPDSTYVDVSDRGAVMFHATRRCTLNGCNINGIEGFAVSVTGYATSPATIVTISDSNIITGNVFNYFQQLSTYGAGTNGLIVSDNHFMNAWGSGIKLSENILQDVSAQDSTGSIVISNNVFKWTKDFVVPFIYDGVTRWFQNAVYIQGAQNMITISGNSVDLSRFTQLNDETSAIKISSRINLVGYITRNILIESNNILAQERAFSIGINGARSISIKNNLISGGIGFYGTDIYPEQFDLIDISNNTFTKPTNLSESFIFAQELNFKDIMISNNIFSTVTDLTLEQTKTSALGISGNNGSLGRIRIQNNSEVSSFYINNNTVEAINVTTIVSCLTYSVDGNSIRTADDSTKGIVLVLDSATKANTAGSVSANSFVESNGTVPSTFLDLNGGKVMLNGNSIYDRNVAYVLDASVIIMAGRYAGTGAPTANAFTGVLYSDFGTSVQADSNYIKGGNTTDNSNWGKISIT